MLALSILFRTAVLVTLSASVQGLPSGLHNNGNVDMASGDKGGAALDEFLRSTSVSSVAIDRRDSSSASSSPLQKAKDATVTLCTGPHSTGQCYNSTWSISTCIDLHDYAHNTQTFIPQSGSSCLLTQSRCDVSVPYASFDASDFTKPNSTIAARAEDLRSYFPWAGEVSSYICFAEMEALRRFVRVQRLKVARLGSPL